ncbi:ribosome-associated translation inhibitor RaiA [Jannaschia sp. Os4]|uniref:ribosome hibernation-promoting factor, HPF/YfiA family n=1 Tax=Jannaschia sp. Os4 TaxID=2807617 RepID=UPI00193A1E78|nr:ribosome-associated translation inhibitor RaiA [Jannaschia sp. Os4]MBM2575622.1 ribosome-associated translation inhibitor RaiA [Jannaschia sp. Os4]
MRTQITGKHIDIGQALQGHVKTALEAVLDKYARRPTDAQVVFSKSGHEFVCESVVHMSTGMNVAATGRAGEIYAAFDACTEKMEKQMRRYKRRLKDHHAARSTPIASEGASSYILAPEDGGEEPETLQPVIVAETETRLPSLSVGEAVMQMELAGAPALVFRNEKGGALNVVYRRDDGNVGWIDPAP